MPDVSVLVCDDSSLARKQLLRALPADWPVRISQAENGLDALELLQREPVDLIFLDLTMPVLDGYEVLDAIQEQQLPCRAIVVSGDVQQEAIERTHSLGALAFLKKPLDPQILRQTLEMLGLLEQAGSSSRDGRAGAACSGMPDHVSPELVFRDTFREVVNVAMGQAAALLARLLGVFIQLPVPNVNVLEVSELHMALANIQTDERLTAVCQGYITQGISGEALLIFHDSEVADMARLMGGEGDDVSMMEMLLDMSSILIGACLTSISRQLDLCFSQGHPLVLGESVSIDQLIRLKDRWRKTLAVEISYSIEGHNIHFNLLLLFTEDSIPFLQKKLAYLME